jgi:hypothetical protein
MPTVRLVVWVAWPEELVVPALALVLLGLEHAAAQAASAATAAAAAPSRVTLRVEVG